MNKTIIFSIFIIIVLVAIFIINSNKTEAPTPDDLQNNEETENVDSEPVTTLEDGAYTIDTSKSVINWQGSKKIVKEWIDTGTIKLLSGEIVVENQTATSKELLIDMNSISTDSTGSGQGEDSLTQHLKSDDFFNVQEFPTSTFVATSIAPTGSEGEFDVTGNLTVKGITNEINFPAEATRQGDTYRIKGNVDVDRTKWNIRYGSDSFFDNLGDNVISDTINIEFDIWTNPTNE
jgi:polyisoprenoid-binding protein YceI